MDRKASALPAHEDDDIDLIRIDIFVLLADDDEQDVFFFFSVVDFAMAVAVSHVRQVTSASLVFDNDAEEEEAKRE
eukprot:4606062-Ditylum_brightwellii.AAC.1